MIEREDVHPGFTKLHLKGLPGSPVLHHFTAPDVGEDWHSHPWRAHVYIVHGGYVEERLQVWADGTFQTWRQERRAHESFVIEPEHAHRIVELPWGETLTLAQYGPCVQTSMFYRRDGDRIISRPWHQPHF